MRSRAIFWLRPDPGTSSWLEYGCVTVANTSWFSKAYRAKACTLELMTQSTRPVAKIVFCGGPAPASCGPTRDVNANAGRVMYPASVWLSHVEPNGQTLLRIMSVDDKFVGGG